MRNISWLVVVFLLSTAVPSQAELRLFPRVSFEEQYTDNLYLDTTRESDWITGVSPGLNFSYRESWVTSSLDYSLDFLYYANHSDENQTSLSDTQRILANATLFPSSPFKLMLADEMGRVAVNTRQVDTLEDNVNNKATRNRFEAIPELTLNFGPTWTTVVAGGYERVDFQNHTGDNTQRYQARLGVTKKMSPRLSLLGDAIATWLDSTDNDDYFRHEYLFGFDYQWSRAITLRAKAGPSWTEFDTRGSVFGVSKEVAVTYQLEPLSGLISYSSTLENEADEGAYTQDRFRAEAGYGRRLSMVAGVTWTRNDFQEVDRRDKTIGGDLTLRWKLSSTMDWSNGLTYDRLTFDPEGEKIHRYGLSSELSMALLQTLKLGLSYTHRRDDSSDDANDYFNNIMLVRVTWQR